MRKGWFGPKVTGLGIGPKSWEGWLVTVFVLIGLAVSVRFLGPILHDLTGIPRPGLSLLISAFWVGLLVGVALLTFEKKAR